MTRSPPKPRHASRLAGRLPAALICLSATIAASPGHAQTAASPTGEDASEPGFATNLFADSRSTLLGDMFGLRSRLGNLGITIGLSETSEVLGNVTGGIRRGAAYDGLTLMNLGLDTQKAFGWEGGTFNISALQIHGRNFSAENLGSLQTSSGIAAERATRLWELWYQQAFLEGRVDVKIGQQAVDQEFMTSVYSSVFMNTVMGWPMLPSADLYAGGPAYPLSSPGVRLRAKPTENITVLAGVFDDNPPGGPFDNDSQVHGAEQSGTAFNLNTGALFIAELQYAVNQPSTGQMSYADQTPGLPGTYKLGAWFDTGSFPDQRFDTTGLSLADPTSSGIPRSHRHNYSLYAVADQMVWQPDPQGPRSVGVFARIMGAPGDRNLISFSFNAGISLKAPLPTRDDDTLAFGYGLARVSSRAAALDRDTVAFSGLSTPVRSNENFVELTYQYQLAPWWQLQPDIQYVFLPGGGVADPTTPGKRIGNALVVGMRTTVTF